MNAPQEQFPVRNAPRRALHVFGRLNRGGAESWLMDVVRRVERDRLAIDVCVIGTGSGVFEPEFESLGGTVHRCPLSAGFVHFNRSLGALLSDHNFDVVHSHVYMFSGAVLRVAAKTGVPQRIAHIHPVEDVRSKTFLRRLYARWMRQWICRYGTHFVGPTRASMEHFWGEQWSTDPHKSVIYNGVDVRRFQNATSTRVRDVLGIPPEAKLALNVSRFAPHKR